MSNAREIVAPGRVNLIGEHIDYLDRDVLPVAVSRAIRLRYTPREDRRISGIGQGPFGPRHFEWSESIEPFPQGDWGNYVKAAAQGVAQRWGVHNGIDFHVTSDLPTAAGLSSSSALVVASALALLRANGIDGSLEELMEVLPAAEHYVGTRGGGMDHAVCLAGRSGHALRISFSPLHVDPVEIPSDWGLFIAHSQRTAEKSAGAREEYNLRRRLSGSALEKTRRGEALDQDEARCFRHLSSETARVADAVDALHVADLRRFGRLLLDSHESLRGDLQVSCREADDLVEACLRAGATGARITGAGFGGYVVGVCPADKLTDVMHHLRTEHYGPDNDPAHLMPVVASNGALYNE